MGKINFRNKDGEIIKTEHKYSKGPLYFVNESEDNSIFAINAQMSKDSDPLKSLWMRYYNDVIYRDAVIHEDRSKDLYEVLRNIENEAVRDELLHFLKKIKYDPYEELPDIPITYVKKVQTFIKDNFGKAKGFEVNSKLILVSYDKKDDRIFSKMYLDFIDGVVLYRYSHTSIILNDDIEAIYENLVTKEDFWKLSKNGVIHTNGKKTGLTFYSQKLLERIFV